MESFVCYFLIHLQVKNIPGRVGVNGELGNAVFLHIGILKKSPEKSFMTCGIPAIFIIPLKSVLFNLIVMLII